MRALLLLAGLMQASPALPSPELPPEFLRVLEQDVERQEIGAATVGWYEDGSTRVRID